MKFIASILLLFSIQAFSQTQDPANLMVKPYKVAVSTSPLCTNLTELFEASSPSYVDFLISPTIGSGQLANGTYPCVVIEISSVIKYQPTTTTGACDNSTEETLNICQNGVSSTLIDGTTVSCDGTSDRRVAMYLTTASTWTTGAGDPFEPPTSIGTSSEGIQLNTALIMDGTSSAKFVVNGSGKIQNSNCEMYPPSFGFEKL